MYMYTYTYVQKLESAGTGDEIYLNKLQPKVSQNLSSIRFHTDHPKKCKYKKISIRFHIDHPKRYKYKKISMKIRNEWLINDKRGRIKIT
jgi:hypothetical protein